MYYQNIFFYLHQSTNYPYILITIILYFSFESNVFPTTVGTSVKCSFEDKWPSTTTQATCIPLVSCFLWSLRGIIEKKLKNAYNKKQVKRQQKICSNIQHVSSVMQVNVITVILFFKKSN